MKRILVLLGIYAVAMALLEAAVVVYMRRLYYPENPLELFPLHFLDDYDPRLELSREAATIMMILAVALLAERRSLTRSFAAFVFVFGVWDLCYYVWLKVLIDWPQRWLEWDVLFLIPSVWLGPWICPAAIAMLFVVWGSWTLLSRREITFTTTSSVDVSRRCRPGPGSLHAARDDKWIRDAKQLCARGVLLVVVLAELPVDGRGICVHGTANQKSNGIAWLTRRSAGCSWRLPSWRRCWDSPRDVMDRPCQVS